MKLTWKNSPLRLLALAGVLSVLLGSGGQSVCLPESRAADTKKLDPADDKEVVSTKATKRTLATTVNFNKSLGLSFDSLRSLGSRIESARRKPDPVALAHAASELSVAEKVSGKTASLTAKELIQEAAQLAAARKQVAELQALVHVSTQVQVEDSEIANLKDQLAIAQKSARDSMASFKRNEEPTNVPRTVTVNNYTTQYLDVYYNGNYLGQVYPGTSQAFTLNLRVNPVVLTAYGNEDSDVWGPRNIFGRFTKYTWNIQ